MKKFGWGIFGTGAISAKFVSGLKSAANAEASFIASRKLATARTFADGMRIPRAIEGYGEAVRQGGVDAVYIATPPSEHLAHALLCIDAGIPVLIEKPMATNAVDVRRIVEAARAKSVFAMEGLWTRFLPAARAMRETVAKGVAGNIRFVVGSFGTSQLPAPGNGIFNPQLGGGAVSHLAPYPLSLSQWLFGTPRSVHAIGTIGPTGVDEDAAFQLQYANGIIGSFFVSARAWAPDDFQVLGERGMIALRGSVIRPYGLSVSQEEPMYAEAPLFGLKARLRRSGIVHTLAQVMGRSGRGAIAELNYRYSGNGFHYEADEVRACVERGQGESVMMPLSDSVAVAATSDMIRESIRTNGSRAES